MQIIWEGTGADLPVIKGYLECRQMEVTGSQDTIISHQEAAAPTPEKLAKHDQAFGQSVKKRPHLKTPGSMLRIHSFFSREPPAPRVPNPGSS